VIFLAVTHCGDAVRVCGKIVELGGSLVPIASAQPGVAASVASVAHESLLHEIKLNGTTAISDEDQPALALQLKP
jgi:hypothetical protein